MTYIGDFALGGTVYIPLTTATGAGGAVAPSSAFEVEDFRVYKNGSTTQKSTTNGITIASPFDSVVGLHALAIDTSNATGDAGFWSDGGEYAVVAVPDETVDGKTVVAVVATFSIGRALAASRIAAIAAASATAVVQRVVDGTEGVGAVGTILHAISTMIEFVGGLWRWKGSALSETPQPLLTTETVYFASAGALIVDSALGSLATENRLNNCLMRITDPSGNIQLRWIRAHFLSGGRAGFNPDLDFVPTPQVGDTVEIFDLYRGAVNVVNWRGEVPSVLSSGRVAVQDSTGVTSILNKLLGITRLDRWLAAIMGKGTDATTLGEINATAAGATYNNATQSLEALSDAVGSIGAGVGPYQLTITVDDGTTPLGGVNVQLVGTDRAGTTKTDGTVLFNVSGNATYTVRVTAPVGFEQPADVSVSVAEVDTAETISLTATTYTEETAPFSNVILPVTDGSGTGLVGVPVKIDFLGFAPGGSPVANVLNPLGIQTSVSPGVVQVRLLRFGKYKATFTNNGVVKVREFIVADAGSQTVTEPI